MVDHLVLTLSKERHNEYYKLPKTTTHTPNFILIILPNN